MKILNDDLSKHLKKENYKNLFILIGITLILGVIIFLILYFQRRELQTLYVILATIATALYIFFVWLILYASVIPIRRYQKIIYDYNNVGHQKLTLVFLEEKEKVETIKRLECHCLSFKFTDNENEIHFYIYKDVNVDLEPGKTYEVNYRDFFLGEYQECTQD